MDGQAGQSGEARSLQELFDQRRLIWLRRFSLLIVLVSVFGTPVNVYFYLVGQDSYAPILQSSLTLLLFGASYLLCRRERLEQAALVTSGSLLMLGVLFVMTFQPRQFYSLTSSVIMVPSLLFVYLLPVRQAVVATLLHLALYGVGMLIRGDQLWGSEQLTSTEAGYAFIVVVGLALFEIFLLSRISRRFRSVLDRNAELFDALRDQNDSLQQARDDVMRSDQEKRSFLASMSYRLRTPLNAILGYVELIQEESEEVDDADIRRDLHHVRNASHALLWLIESILTVSKLEAGLLETDLRPIETASFLDDLCQRAALEQPDGDNAPLELTLDPKVPATIQSDTRHLSSILLELVHDCLELEALEQLELRALPAEDGGLLLELRCQSSLPFVERSHARPASMSQPQDEGTQRHDVPEASSLRHKLTGGLADQIGARLETRSEDRGELYQLWLPAIPAGPESSVDIAIASKASDVAEDRAVREDNPQLEDPVAEQEMPSWETLRQEMAALQRKDIASYIKLGLSCLLCAILAELVRTQFAHEAPFPLAPALGLGLFATVCFVAAYLFLKRDNMRRSLTLLVLAHLPLISAPVLYGDNAAMAHFIMPALTIFAIVALSMFHSERAVSRMAVIFVLVLVLSGVVRGLLEPSFLLVPAELYASTGVFVALIIVVSGLGTAQLVQAFRAAAREGAELNLRWQRRNLNLELTRHEIRRSIEARSTFLASMSHELRTPLNAILGYTELIIEQPSPLDRGQLGKDLQKINISANLLLELLSESLDPHTMAQDHVELDISRFDLGKLLAEIEIAVTPLIHRGDNALVLEGVDQLEGFELHSDRTKLKQILLNLLSNAAKFTHEAKIVLGVARREEQIILEVRDEGVGISPQDLERLFEAYVQVGEERGEQGTGLGLSITKRLTEAMGGSVEVESQLGEGSTFRVKLPLEATST